MYFVPTRGRPDRLQKFLNGCIQTKMTMPGLIVVDGKDGGDYSRVILPKNWTLEVAEERLEACGRMESYFKSHPSAEFYAMITDDVVPMTRYWDQSLALAAGDWNMAYPDDTISGEKMATNFVIGGKLARCVGSFGLNFIHTMVDRAWMDIAREIGRLIYCPSIKLRHDHWSIGRSQRDATYQRIFEGKDTRIHDKKRYDRFISRDLVPIIQRIQKTMEAYGEPFGNPKERDMAI